MECPSKSLHPPTIKVALPEQHEVLTKIAIASKAHWGYDQAFMEQCAAELTINEAFISDSSHRVYVACCHESDLLLGFYAMAPVQERQGEAELEALFVLPSQIGSGIGSRLFRHCCAQARGLGYEKLTIQSDPFAEDFYSRMGAKKIADKASQSIPNRTLPLMQFDL